MGRYLFALFLLVPIVEIAIFVAMGGLVGFWWTMGGVVFTAVLGSYLLRLQGFAVWAEVQGKLGAGQFPGRSIVDGIMLAIAGALLLTPGFFTDAVGFALFVPQVRYFIFEQLRQRISIVSASGYTQYSSQYSAQDPTHRPSPLQNEDGVIDLEDERWRGKDQ
ncbi:FxsA family protein [Maritalea porphyrae]|uniref:FxsA family protein n=1 Tax=Maritalea porphyrae TaxID=880732 RepID=UPI0022B03FB0|nr:FxsA family protein [Maritalea porphyrae]MCZ4272250.1 FxsA family protein [Maritalea porphyrae]